MDTIRLLTFEDLSVYQKMQTGVEKDYMLDVFKRLTTTNENRLFGYFVGETLVAVAGYTYFPGGNVMLGRLRSDYRYRKQGYPTKLLTALVKQLSSDKTVRFIGGYTHISNTPAKKIMSRLGFQFIDTHYSFACTDLSPFLSSKTRVWDELITFDKKKAALERLTHTTVTSFTYEAYYPFPYSERLIPEEKLNKLRIFQSPKTKEYLYMDEDFKGEDLLVIRYFSDDLFDTPGLFDTIHFALSGEHRLPWFDFSPNQFNRLIHQDAFQIEKGWELHGMTL